jgi:hypothetical protein
MRGQENTRGQENAAVADAPELPGRQDRHEVLVSFTDADGTVYWVGGTYPADGRRPGAERVAYLQGSGNRFKKPVIAGTAKK